MPMTTILADVVQFCEGRDEEFKNFGSLWSGYRRSYLNLKRNCSGFGIGGLVFNNFTKHSGRISKGSVLIKIYPQVFMSHTIQHAAGRI